MILRPPKSAALAILLTILGCYGPGQPIQDFVIAQSNYDSQRTRIEQTQTSITVHGHLLGEGRMPLQGDSFYSFKDLGFGSATLLVAVGWREHLHFGGNGQGIENPCSVTTVGQNFDIEMPDTQKLTLFVLKKGYEPVTLDVRVPLATKGKAAPVTVEKTIVMRQMPITTQAARKPFDDERKR
jgi:hypothetical protein